MKPIMKTLKCALEASRPNGEPLRGLALTPQLCLGEANQTKGSFLIYEKQSRGCCKKEGDGLTGT